MRNLTEALLKKGHGVRILDDFSTGKRENLTFRNHTPSLDIVEGDIRDLVLCQKAMEGVDYVFHQAALPSVQRSVEDPLGSNAVNVGGTLNVLLAARDAKVKRVMYASSSSIYGDTPTLPKKEDMVPTPLSPYALQKYTGEQYCRLFSQLYGLETVSLRYFNIFGPRQDPNSVYSAVIPRFIDALLHRRSPIVYGDGEQSRDFTYIDNVVDAVLTACKAEKVRQGEFNLACGSQYTLRDLVDQLNALIGKNIKPKIAPIRPGDIKHSYADASKLQKEFGIKPIVDFGEGLEKTISFFR